MKSKIFVITHKKIEMDLLENYIPIQVGNYDSINSKYILDNTGDNISKKNANYCELTGIYWIWKNYDLPQYIGISHYRRYFISNNLTMHLIDDKKIEKFMKKYDIIVPKKFFFKRKIWDNYFLAGAGKEKDLIILKDVLKEIYPDYIKEFEKIMNSKSGYYCNMFVMERKKFCEYCTWIFKILGEVENKIDISQYSKQEARIYGYMSEILFNVWIEHHSFNLKEYPMVKIDDSILKRVKNQMKTIIIRLYNLIK